jgi:ferritin
MAFDIERFLEISRAVDTSDLDWDYIARTGVTDDEAVTLRYMADIETHTIIYLRDLLSGHTARDGEITAFLSCWVYEELNHGRAIDRFLAAAGRPPEVNRYEKVTAAASWWESLEAFLTVNVPKLTTQFAATHMAWGALNEMTAAAAYQQLAAYTRNRELSKMLLRIAKDERRHQSFYYHQAEKRLNTGLAKWLLNLAMKRFWSPVGLGVGDDGSLEFIACFLFDDERGQNELKAIDRQMAKLPGLEWFDRATYKVSESIATFEKAQPQRAAEIRARKQEIDAAMAPAARKRTASAEMPAVM